METLINNKQVSFDSAGWLEDRESWDEEVAIEIARSVDIELTKEHWTLIYIARSYYEEHHACCPTRAFSRILRKRLGKDQCDQRFIYKLFPAGGLVHCVNKIAGLPCPCGRVA
jgi:tRNA 2-thiouridine synthesizing protein E